MLETFVLEQFHTNLLGLALATTLSGETNWHFYVSLLSKKTHGNLVEKEKMQGLINSFGWHYILNGQILIFCKFE